MAVLAGLGIWLSSDRGPDVDTDLAMVPTETIAPEPSVRQARVRAMLNLRRAPMLLHVDEGDGDRVQDLALPSDGALATSGRAQMNRLSALQDDLVASGRNLVLQLPSGRDDFALFQAQRRDALHGGDSTDGGSEIAQRDASVALATPGTRRTALFDDDIIILNTRQMLLDVLTDAGFDIAQAEAIASAVNRIAGVEGEIDAGSVVALRSRTGPEVVQGRQLLQLSLYAPDRYLASLAQNGPGRFARAADPWAEQDLLQRSDQLMGQDVPGRSVRLMDALYSTALRNGVSTGLVGELIVMMSRRFDLERLAEEGERLVLLFSSDVEEGSAGQILYAGIEGSSESMQCYVTQKSGPEASFGCFDGASGGGGGMRLGAGLAIPVTGVKTSGFGMRMHPIRDKMLPHNGVDWAAPEGTPVYAARAERDPPGRGQRQLWQSGGDQSCRWRGDPIRSPTGVCRRDLARGTRGRRGADRVCRLHRTLHRAASAF